jgi:predicted negative regulator of RcsB-dependent stress response
MSEYLSEEEQVEALKKWWKENGRSIIAGAVLGLGGVFGWQAWTQHQDRTAEQASGRFEQMQLAFQTGSNESVTKQAEILLSEHGDSAYALFAALLSAKVKHEEGDAGGARAQLEWVVANSDEPSFQQIARLRLARLLLDENDVEGAAAVIAQTSSDNFAGEVAEVRGDIARSKKDYVAARQAYQEALDKGVGDVDLVKMKLDDLAIADAKL